MSKAKAAVFLRAGAPFEIREYEVVEPAAGFARLSLAASGVCGTDVHIHTGRLAIGEGTIIGHEFVGAVDAISEADSQRSGLRKGDLGIVDIAVPCGECALCRAGDDANCVNMRVTNGGDPATPPHFHGGYAEYSFAPVSNIIRLPAGLDPVAACVFACPGPTALHAFRLAEQAGFRVGEAGLAVVQGLGPVATFAVAYLHAIGVRHVLAVAYHIDGRRAELARALGADELIDLADTSDEQLLGIVRERSGGLGADLVFEASGSPKAIPVGMSLLRNRGVYLVPGQYSDSGPVEIAPQLITFNALHIIGSSQYSISDVHAYVRFLEEHPALLPTVRALATVYPLTEVNRAFDDAKAHRNIKTVLSK